MLQRRSGAGLQPPALHTLASQQQLLHMKLLQQQRLLRQAQARPFQQVGPALACSAACCPLTSAPCSPT